MACCASATADVKPNELHQTKTDNRDCDDVSTPLSPHQTVYVPVNQSDVVIDGLRDTCDCDGQALVTSQQSVRREGNQHRQRQHRQKHR